jgi:hypothetical protein
MLVPCGVQDLRQTVCCALQFQIEAAVCADSPNSDLPQMQTQLATFGRPISPSQEPCPDSVIHGNGRPVQS